MAQGFVTLVRRQVVQISFQFFYAAAMTLTHSFTSSLTDSLLEKRSIEDVKSVSASTNLVQFSERVKMSLVRPATSVISALSQCARPTTEESNLGSSSIFGRDKESNQHLLEGKGCDGSMIRDWLQSITSAISRTATRAADERVKPKRRRVFHGYGYEVKEDSTTCKDDHSITVILERKDGKEKDELQFEAAYHDKLFAGCRMSWKPCWIIKGKLDKREPFTNGPFKFDVDDNWFSEKERTGILQTVVDDIAKTHKRLSLFALDHLIKLLKTDTGKLEIIGRGKDKYSESEWVTLEMLADVGRMLEEIFKELTADYKRKYRWFNT